MKSPEKDKVQLMKKQMAHMQAQFKKQKAHFLQQNQLLRYEIQQQKRQDQETRKLNETVISSYKNSDHARDQMLQTSLQQVDKKHKQQIQRMVSIHAKNLNNLQAQIKQLKQKLQVINESKQQVRFEIQKDLRIRMQQQFRKQKQSIQNELRQYKNKLAIVESKLKKADQLIKTYRQQGDRIDYQSQKNQLLKSCSIQYSFISALEKKKNDDDQMSKFYQSKRDEKSQMMKSHSIMPRMTLRESDINQKENRGTPYTRRMSSRQFIQEVQQSTRKSRKYLQVNRQSVDNLTSRISKAVKSVEKMNRNVPNFKMADLVAEKVQRKLRLH